MAIDMGMQNTARQVAMEWSTLENQFIDSLHRDRTSTHFATLVSKLWHLLPAQMNTMDLFSLRVAMDHRQIMLLSAASWYWLTVDCVTRTHECLDALEQDSEVYQHTNDWLCKLV